MKYRASAVLACFALGAMLIHACSEGDIDSTSTPTPTSPVASTPDPSSRIEATETAGGFSGRIFGITLNSIRAEALRVDGGEEWVHFACYEASEGVNEIGAQRLSVYDAALLDEGESHTFALDLPNCVWQCDLAVGERPKEPPFYTPANLIVHRDSVQVGFTGLPQVCSPPTTTTTPPRTTTTTTTTTVPTTTTTTTVPPPTTTTTTVPSACDDPIPDGGPFPQQGIPRAECAFFGDFVPVYHDPDFYICKAGTEMFASPSPFLGRYCPNGKRISHITKCACEAPE